MLLNKYVEIIRRRWIWVLVVFLGSTAIAAQTSLDSTSYTARSEILFAVNNGNSATDLNQAATYLTREMTTFAAIAKSPYILNPVIRQLGLETNSDGLAQRIAASVPTNTVLLNISARGESPEDAAALANAVADEIARAAVRSAPQTSDGSASLRASVIARAEAPALHTKAAAVQQLAIAGLAGMLLGVLTAFLAEALLSRSPKSEQLRKPSMHRSEEPNN